MIFPASLIVTLFSLLQSLGFSPHKEVDLVFLSSQNDQARPVLIDPNKESQQQKDSPLSDNTKEKEAESLSSLNHFFQSKKALEIHNQALRFLKKDQKAEATLLLEKNFYHNFFVPSFLILSHLKIPLLFSPFIWHILLLLSTGLCLLYLFPALKKRNAPALKKLLLFSFIHLVLLGSGFLTLKERVSPLTEINLKSTPFEASAIDTSVSANTHLQVLKNTKDWFRVQTPDKQSGWLKKQDVFQIF